MSLAIRTLSTRCRAPRPLERAVTLIDVAARNRLASELAARLGPSLDRVPGVVRIRTLPLRIAIPASELTPSKLCEAWVAAFLHALFQALACPTGEGPFEIVRYESRARQIAAFVRARLAGRADGWEFASWQDSAFAAAPGSVFDSCGTAAELRELLVALETERVLEPLLLLLDDLALERLVMKLATTRETLELKSCDLESAAMILKSWENTRGSSGLLRGALRALARPGDTLATTTRRIALVLHAFCLSGHDAAASMPPRALFHALLALAAIVEVGALGGAAERLPRQPAADEARRFLRTIRLASDVESVARAVANVDASIRVETLTHEPDDERWVESPVASIFLLAPIVSRLGWGRLTGVTYLLVAVAEHLLRPHRPQAREERTDAAVALFAGCFGDLDRTALRAFLAGRESEIASMAETLVTELRLRIRGFRDAPLPSVVRQFLCKPGRIRVEERRLTVFLDPSPFHVAVHLSGADDPIEQASWLGDRSVAFVLGGI